MNNQIFVNLPVKDLTKSKAFYEHLGFTINPHFSDETAACVVLSESIFVMLLTHPKAKQFTSKAIADAHKTTEVLNCLSAESKNEVNEMVDKAVNFGGSENGNPKDHGFMFQRSFNDLDGHIWEVMWMDMSKMPSG